MSAGAGRERRPRPGRQSGAEQRMENGCLSGCRDLRTGYGRVSKAATIAAVQ